MTRRTRAETQSRTRELLLLTARELLMRDGYQATSIAEIADAAGFTTGAVYSNFAGKRELALLVLREIQAERLDEVQAILDGPRLTDAALDRLRDWAERALSSGWPGLELEFALDARSSATMVAAEADRYDSAVDLVADALDRQLPPALTALLPVRSVADNIVNLAIGLAIRRMIDPRISVDSLIDLLRRLVPLSGG